MDSEKPFKTIEVIDNDTKQVCKIACMSCIRGHRTTSCGIPVCRNKLFWTVKRPGRPSNSCTCRFHSSGVCKCVTPIPKCPHKSNKKGEKRSSECRCDEQGRFCCLLEPAHWERLMRLEKPTVQFFSSRDALEEWQSVQSPVPPVSTPAVSFYSVTPQRTGSCCGSSTAQGTPLVSRSTITSPSDMTSPLSNTVMSRFDIMGIESPMNANNTAPADAWLGDPPITPTEMVSIESPQAEEMMQNSCCQASTESYQQATPHAFDQAIQYQPSFVEAYPTYSDAPAAFDLERWSQNYQIYQFPNAICQNCGLNGCTCRSCPPLMQNFGTTSWAQSCGRRHARAAPMPVAAALQPVVHQMQHSQLHQMQTPTQSLHIQPVPLERTATYDDPLLSSAPDPLTYSDFLMHQLDRPSHVADDHMFGG